MQPGPCHRHGFAALINGARCIATMQPASPVSIARIPPVDWGCQWTGKYAIKGRLIHAIQPWFVSKDACAEYSILAFIECDEEQRPKLRKAIIEAMLWAQTQPKLTS
jgi:hypothetical protein